MVTAEKFDKFVRKNTAVVTTNRFDRMSPTERVNVELIVDEPSYHGVPAYKPQYNSLTGDLVLKKLGYIKNLPDYGKDGGNKYDKGELIQELRRLAKELRRTPSSGDLIEHGNISPSPYYRVFENFTEALVEARLLVSARGAQ